MIELTLQEIHEETINVMKKLDSLLNELGLKYYLAYGTLLGAVRHHGFIPWDDDADIWMPREDYNKFVSYCNENKERILPYKLCNRASTKNYYYGLSRFSNNYSYEVTSKRKPVDIGIFIDIYPLDNYGNSINQVNKIRKKTTLMNHLYSAYLDPRGINIKLSIIRPFAWLYMHIKHKGNYHLQADKDIENYIRTHTSNTDLYVGIPAWPIDENGALKKEWFNETTLLEFEGMMLPAPSGWKEILIEEYGDYMTLPPEDQRIPHHNYKIYKK